ncbi:Wadjet anti-phage system protein JetD domain-containing protein [Paenibacillus sp. MMS20-IR301]|uniref:Wadjet anti-phage system protein JetD domain-containing protein n=1 Tax=Paenibacillus sp. MMS20-IR301 TaxID=2895946 RepID=UPI0028E5921C|nr:Wadjet anti-phage system protein JetD domain-containing protein [Paenibacillus sp. MMS20-IR301]WNS40849.1 DUF2220 family protein [Paenibacillus sp. MMS20-IR301]
MIIKSMIEEHLSDYKKTTITLEELEQLFAGRAADPRDFAGAVMELESSGVLEPVKSAGRTMKQPSLGYRYRVNKQYIMARHNHQLQQYRLKLHPAIGLDSYFALSEQQFVQDRPWIERIDHFLHTHGFPDIPVPAPERSFQLTGNEKWITELGGYSLLKRLGLWDQLLILPVSDPLMFAVNPQVWTNPAPPRCLHFIVENKTTFQALLPVLPSSSFSTLIYGCGNKITGNLDMFTLQYPVTGSEHVFYYFGDLDYEGIRIWYDADKRLAMIPALPFYDACLAKPCVPGKSNQRRNEEAVQAFSNWFPQEQQGQIENTLSSGSYYPQETLMTHELQHIWGSGAWKQWTDLN